MVGFYRRKKKLPWFVTPTGRKFSKGIVFAMTSGGFLVYYLPNTFLVDQYQSTTHLYRYGTPVKLHKRIPPLVSEVMNDLKLSQEKQDLLSIYACTSFRMYYAGMLPLKMKSVLGIPANFFWNNAKEFDQNAIRIDHEPLDWTLPEAQTFKESLLFSDDAKKFAIARQIAMLDTLEPMFNGISSSIAVLMCSSMSMAGNRSLNLFTKPRFLRFSWYCLTATFSFVTWIFLKDISCVHYETSAEEAAASISESYARGGLEYYEKILKCNIALRTLMGSRGKDTYTSYGNIKETLRFRHLPYTDCLDMMKNKIKMFEEARKEKLPTNTETEKVACEENTPTETKDSTKEST